MDRKPTVEEVLLTLNCLFYNPNQTEKENASLWLEQLQKSVFGWTIADELLHLKQNMESCYFGAHTLRKKIQSCFLELPFEAHASLRDSLIEHLNQINESTNTAIVTQLCLALIGVVLNMTSWKEPVLDLISRFWQTHTMVLLEILTLLPEELNSCSTGLGQNRRSEFEQQLVGSSPKVKNFLTLCSDNALDVQVNVKIVKCFTSWVHISAIFSNDIVSNDILFKIFRTLNDGTAAEALHDACTEFVYELTKCLRTANNSYDYILEGFLLNNISLLEDSFLRSITEINPGKTRNYCRIFVDVANALIPEMLRKDAEYHYGRLLNLLVICAYHNDFRLAEITFDFWYPLSYELALENSKTLCNTFVPYVDQLFAVLFQRCHMAANHEGLLEEKDDFFEFRRSASEMIYDLCFIVKDTNWFSNLAKNLTLPEATWNVIEASLFIMQTVSKNLNAADDKIVLRVVEIVLNLAENVHIAIKHSAIILLGVLPKWINRHPGLLIPILSFLITSLSHPKLETAAAKALKNVFRFCKTHLVEHVPVLLEVVQSVDSVLTDNQSILDLLEGIAGLISYMPEKDIEPNLLKICALQINPLSQLMNGDFSIVKDSRTDPAVWLKRLRYIFKEINWRSEEDHSMITTFLVVKVWPTLTRAMIKYQHDFRIVDRCCTCMDAVLSCVKSEVSQLVEHLVTILMNLYETYQHSCCLYLGTVLVDHYGTNSSCIGNLMKMFKEFVNPTFKLLETSDKNADIVQEFYILCCRMVKRCPLDFLNNTEFLPVFQKTLFLSSLGNENLNEYLIKFLENLFTLDYSDQENFELQELKKLMNNIFMNYGQELTIVLFRACTYTLNSDVIEKVAEVITEMLYFDGDASQKYIEWSLESLQNQNKGETQKITPEQLDDIYCSIISGNVRLVEKALKYLKELHQ